MASKYDGLARIITNADDFADVVPTQEASVAAGDVAIHLL